MATGRPNILFAFADDWGRYASVYRKVAGDNSLSAIISTPTVDRIANEGALFTNALVPAPTCTPCRSSVLSGRYFWQTRLGAILQGAVWDENIPSYPRILEKSGYHTGATWKVWGPGVCPGVTPYGTSDHYYEKAGSRFNQFSHETTAMVAAGRDVDGAKRELYDEVRGNFVDFMNDRADDQPFCYWWGPTNTHRTWEKGSGKKLWKIDPDDLEGKLPDFFPDVHDVREDVADYLGECMAFDRGLETIVAELEQRDELDNTLIVVSGDHGMPGFPRAKCNLYDIGCEVSLMARLSGKIPAGSLIEEMTNVMDLAPTFLEVANCDRDSGMAATSLWGRLTGRAGPRKDAWVITGRERHVATAREGNLPYPQRAIRTREFLYIINFAPDRWPAGDPGGMDDPDADPPPWKDIEWRTRSVYPDFDAGPTKAWMVYNRADPRHSPNFELGFGKRPREELYDLTKDPHQMVNSAQDSSYSEVREELHQILMTELRRQRDPRVCEEDCRYENSPFTDVLAHDGPQVLAQAAERLSRSGE